MPFNLEQEWKPNAKQARFLSIPWSIKEAAYMGGAGSGKSELLLMFPIVHRFHEHSRFKQLLLRRTTKQLKKEIVPRSQEIYPKFGATFNESDMVWTFPRPDQFGSGAKNSGARIYLGHCENENDVHIYDSMEINLFTPDEITSLTEFIYMYIGFTRVRSSDPGVLPAVIRAAGMPGDVGHSFVKKRFVDPYPAGSRVLEGKGGIKRIYIHATQADNDKIDPEYKHSLEALPDAEKAAKLYGDWDAYSGQVFSEFRDKQYPDEPVNAIHLIQPFDIPQWWPKLCAIDWGYNAMCSVGWGAISPTKRLYVYRHQVFYKRKIEEWAPSVKYWIDKEQPGEVKICHSANQRRGDPHTIQEQVSEALGVSVSLGERDRIAGKTLLHEFLRWEKKPVPAKEVVKFDADLANWVLRNKGEEEYKRYLSAFQEDPEEDNIPRIQFFDTSDGLVRIICDSIKACVYEKTSADGKKAEDVAEFDGDDPYDMLRLLLHAADLYFNSAIAEQEKLNKVQKVVEKLAVTGNMTDYYRKMREIDSENRVIRPVTRFHYGRNFNSTKRVYR